MHLYDTCKFLNNYLFCPHIKVTIVAFQDNTNVSVSFFGEQNHIVSQP